MSLDIWLTCECCGQQVYSGNITGNLSKMADVAGLYTPMWEAKGKLACDLIEKLESGLEKLKSNPVEFEQYNPPNGWGSYDGLVRFTEEFLEACKKNKCARVDTWR